MSDTTDVTIDIEEQDHTPRFFESREEWDQSLWSPKGRAARWRENTYMAMYRNEPTRFPCYGFEGDLIYRSDGPDEYANYFIYPKV